MKDGILRNTSYNRFGLASRSARGLGSGDPCWIDLSGQGSLMQRVQEPFPSVSTTGTFVRRFPFRPFLPFRRRCGVYLIQRIVQPLLTSPNSDFVLSSYIVGEG